MNYALPQIYLVRHGETDWSLSGKHTGKTDIGLTKNGEERAKHLSKYLKDITFTSVYCSPLLRAKQTCELAGFASVAQLEPDLQEWNYGDYEGLTTTEIQNRHAGWNIFQDGCLNGDSLNAIESRVDRIISLLKKGSQGNVLLFSHGHILRAITACWLNLPVEKGSLFILSPASISILGYEHNNANEPVIQLWNRT